jgi:hypothetical protein
MVHLSPASRFRAKPAWRTRQELVGVGIPPQAIIGDEHVLAAYDHLLFSSSYPAVAKLPSIHPSPDTAVSAYLLAVLGAHTPLLHVSEHERHLIAPIRSRPGQEDVIAGR